MLVHDFLINSAKKIPEKTAVIHGGKDATYGEILEIARARAAWLRSLGLEPGFRGAVLADDPFDYIGSYFAIQMAGGVVVGLNTQTCARSLKTVLNDCTASVLFSSIKFKKYLLKAVPEVSSLRWVVMEGLNEEAGQSGLVQWLDGSAISRDDPGADAFPEISQDDIAQIIYTSGTTGKPKGVMLRHRNLVANTESIIQYLSLNEKERVMAVLPFFYSYGNSVMLTHIAAGGTLVVNQSFLYPNVILDEMVKYKVTGFSGVPSSFAILLNRSALQKYSFPSLRYLTQAGAAMAPQLAERLKEVFPGVKIFIMYGQTEASARLSYLPPEDLDRKSGSIGRAIPGVTLLLLDKKGSPVKEGDVGEIVASGENVMAGYWQCPEETAEVLRSEGLWTGDLARMDEEGYLFMVSRKSDMIKSGSHRISPKEIEEIIHEHEGVHEVAVVGQEDEILGETIKACVVLKSDIQCTPKELTLHCRRNLPPFKVPQEIVILEDLPKTATGKIRKVDLKDPAISASL